MASRSLGTLTLDLVAKIGGFVSGMTAAERQADKSFKRINKSASDFGKAFGNSMANLGGKILAFAGVTLSLGAAFSSLKGAIDSADALRDLSIRVGVGTEQLSAFSYAAKQTGTDIDALGTGFKILAKNANAALDPTSKQAGLFNALGISVKDADGNLKSIGDLVPEIADKFKDLEDGTQKAALAQAVFGKSGLELTEFLNQGSAGLQEFGDRARELGIIISEDTAAAADEFNDKLGDLKAAGQGFATTVASELLPQLSAIVDWAVTFVSDGDNAKRTADDLSSGFRDLASAIATVGEIGGGTLDFLGRTREVLQGLEKQGQATTSVMLGLLRLDMNKVREGVALYNRGSGQVDGTGANFGNAQGSSDTVRGGAFGNVVGGVDTRSASNTAARLAKFFGGGDKASKGGSKKAGKSDEQRDAEQLKAAYDRLIESQKEQIALFGQTSEAAQVRYDTEFGALKNLTSAEKEALITGAEKIDQMRAEAEVQKDLDDVSKRREEAGAAVLKDLQAEMDLLGATNLQRDIYNRLAYAGVEANSALGESIVAQTTLLHEQGEAMDRQIGLMDEFRSGATDALTAFVTGTKSAKEALTDFFDDMAAQITKAIASKWIEQLFGETGSAQSGSAGGGWVSLLAGLFGGGKAGGGAVSPRRYYEVGEYDRPELFMAGGKQFLIPGNAGTVMPMGSTGGGRGEMVQNVNFTIMGKMDRSTQLQISQKVYDEGVRAKSRNR